jgi:hypothetical protein
MVVGLAGIVATDVGPNLGMFEEIDEIDTISAAAKHQGRRLQSTVDTTSLWAEIVQRSADGSQD